MATSKKENDLIQAAVAARLAGKEVDADDLAAQLPEGVEAVPEYSVEDIWAEKREGVTHVQAVRARARWG